MGTLCEKRHVTRCWSNSTNNTNNSLGSYDHYIRLLILSQHGAYTQVWYVFLPEKKARFSFIAAAEQLSSGPSLFTNCILVSKTAFKNVSLEWLWQSTWARHRWAPTSTKALQMTVSPKHTPPGERNGCLHQAAPSASHQQAVHWSARSSGSRYKALLHCFLLLLFIFEVE